MIDRVAAEVSKAKGVELSYMTGTMIELPRAALLAGQIAQSAEFFSFGTNDLTQTTFGLSRDDSGNFLAAYEKAGIFEKDPFTKDLSLGVLDVHNRAVEAPGEVAARIRRGTAVLPADRIWVDPDCGLKTRTIEETRAKLAAMMTAVRTVRAEHG